MLKTHFWENAARAMVQHLAKYPCDGRLTLVYIELHWVEDSLARQFDTSEVSSVVTAVISNLLKARHGSLIWESDQRWLMVFGAPSLYDNPEWQASRLALLMNTHVRLRHSPNNPMSAQVRTALDTCVVGCVLHTFSQFQLNAALAETSPFENELAALAGLLDHYPTQNIVLATSPTRSLLHESPNIRSVGPLGTVTIAPHGLATEVYQILREGSIFSEMVAAANGGIYSTLIDREDEFKTLKSALENASLHGLGSLVTVFGEPGIGKSRLLYEVAQWAGFHPDYGFWLFQGHANEHMTSLPFSFIRRVFTNRFEIRDSDPHSLANQKLVTSLTAFMGESELPEAHFIGHLLGFDFSESPYLQPLLGDPRQIRDRAFFYVAKFLRGMIAASGWSVLVLLDDIHLADYGSLDLIRYIAQSSVDVPIVIIATAPPGLLEHYSGWGSLLTNYIPLHLQRLSPPQAQRQLENLLHRASDIPANFAEILLTKAAGNPYHLEELVKSLIQADIIQPGTTEGEAWKVRNVSLVGSQFPATLPELVRERVQNLPTQEQSALVCASVVGRVFWDGAVADLCGWSVAETRHILGQLARREMVIEREVSTFNRTTEYTFSHETLHRVCYESLTPNLLRHYHARVATWLIGRGMERVGQIAGSIAEHFALAGETQRAVKWYGLAGKQARDTYAPEAAIDYFQTALSLLPYESDDVDQRMALMEGIGRSLDAIGQYAAAATVYSDLAWVAGAEGNVPMQARALSRLSKVQDHLGHPVTAIDTAGMAVKLAQEAGEQGQAELISALISQAAANVSVGNLHDALDLATRAHEIGLAIDKREQIVYALNMIGVVHSTAGRYAEAMQAFNAAMWLAREMGDVRREAILSNNLGELGRRRGEYRKALALFQHSAETARSIAYRSGEQVALNNLGVVRVYLGDYANAEQQLRALIPRLAKINHAELLSEAYCYLGEALDGQDRHAEALHFALQALATAHEADSAIGIGTAWRTLGRISFHMGEPIRVEGTVTLPIDCFKESLRVFTEARMEGEQARTSRTWAHYEIVAGDFSKGEKMWYQARATFTKTGADAEAQRMERLPHERRLTL